MFGPAVCARNAVRMQGSGFVSLKGWLVVVVRLEVVKLKLPCVAR